MHRALDKVRNRIEAGRVSTCDGPGLCYTGQLPMNNDLKQVDPDSKPMSRSGHATGDPSSLREQLAAMRETIGNASHAGPIEVQIPPEPAQEERFVWPPVAGDANRTSTLTSDDAQTNAAATPDETIRLTPDQLHEEGLLTPGEWMTQARCWMRTAGRECRLLLDEVETDLLGLTHRSWRRLCAEAGWVRDGVDAYCPRCGRSVGAYEADMDGCSSCRSKRLPWERLIRLGEYEGVLRSGIVQSKYTPWPRMCRELGREMGEALEHVLESAAVDRQNIVLCPVPISWRRRLSRGIDHTLILAREMGRATRLPVVRCLTREHRPSQASLPLSQRQKNLAGSIHFRRRSLRGIDGKQVILIDDVRTTGMTLRACSLALRRGVKAAGGQLSGVWAAVGAVCDHDPRFGAERS